MPRGPWLRESRSRRTRALRFAPPPPAPAPPVAGRAQTSRCLPVRYASQSLPSLTLEPPMNTDKHRWTILRSPCHGSVFIGVHRWLPLFPDDLDEHPLRAVAIELAVEDLLPRAEVERAVGGRDDDLAAHDLALVMRVAVVFAGAIVVVAL